jgi:hypothetical protein
LLTQFHGDCEAVRAIVPFDTRELVVVSQFAEGS